MQKSQAKRQARFTAPKESAAAPVGPKAASERGVAELTASLKAKAKGTKRPASGDAAAAAPAEVVPKKKKKKQQ